METLRDFEDMLFLLHKHHVHYLVIGGLAFIYHAKPRYTKDMDLWIDATPANINSANSALVEFGSPTLIEHDDIQQIIQIGIAPDRIDLILSVPQLDFSAAWKNRIRGHYGKVDANWISINDLIEIKDNIDDPRHQSDAKNLKRVREMNRNNPTY